MTHVSRKKLSDKVNGLFREALVEVFRKNSGKEADLALSTLLTQTEMTMISKRLMIMFLLNEGYGVDNIAKSTNTTRQTVSRVALSMKLMSEKQKQTILNKLSSWKRKNTTKGILKALWNVRSPSQSIRDAARKAAGW